MSSLQERRPSELTIAREGSPLEQHQRRRMLIALLLLLVALVLVLVKDRQILFPSSTSPDSEVAEPEVTQPVAPVVTQDVPNSARPAPTSKNKKRSTRVQRKPIVATILPNENSPAPPVVVATNRAMLPPLEVEVVAGNRRQALDAGSNSVNVKLQDGIAPRPAAAPSQTTVTSNEDQRVQLSPGAAQVVSHPVDPSYPLLAKQMKVQGAVVLEALINRNGTIQEIQVLSGPAILSAAAREAVRQWRFKPYIQSGRAVDSEARITVNFTISTY